MSTLRLTTISNQSGSSSVPSDTVISGSAKAWVNFNGTGTVAIRASFNVSSITDGGTGIYTANFVTAMPDVNYATTIAVIPDATFASGNVATRVSFINIQSTSSVQVVTGFQTTTVTGFLDFANVYVVIHR